MDQTSWVIQVLDDSHKRSIEYQNRFWLRQNVKKLHISILAEDCVANTFDIAEKWEEIGTILIQEGKKVQIKNDFHPGKEALLLVKDKSENAYLNAYLVFLYSPKE